MGKNLLVYSEIQQEIDSKSDWYWYIFYAGQNSNLTLGCVSRRKSHFKFGCLESDSDQTQVSNMLTSPGSEAEFKSCSHDRGTANLNPVLRLKLRLYQVWTWTCFFHFEIPASSLCMVSTVLEICHSQTLVGRLDSCLLSLQSVCAGWWQTGQQHVLVSWQCPSSHYLIMTQPQILQVTALMTHLFHCFQYSGMTTFMSLRRADRLCSPLVKAVAFKLFAQGEREGQWTPWLTFVGSPSGRIAMGVNECSGANVCNVSIPVRWA